MRMSMSRKIWMTATGFLAALTILGCGTSGDVQWGRGGSASGQEPAFAGKKGPPPWAPAHGHRAKHRYLYFPSCSVYYDTDRSVYFYIEDDRWQVSVDLPSDYSARLGQYVVLEMDADQPYVYHKEHKQKYPPGQMKKKNKSKWSKN